MAFTATQIAEFEQALVDRKGAQQIAFGDQSMTFASYEDALKFLGYMKDNVATAAAGTSRTRYASTSKDV